MGPRQRLGFLALAAAIAVIAVVALGGDDRTEQPAGPSPDPPTEAEPMTGATPRSTPAPRPRPPLLEPGDDEVQVRVRMGEVARFRVRAAEADHVHVHGYDVFRDLPAGRTITVRFRADIPGVFEIELEDSGRPLGRLRVEP